MIFKHVSVDSAVNLKMIDMLIGQLKDSPMERVRESAMNHLYSAGVTLKNISDAYKRDLEAGDRILTQRTHEEQNTAPETQQWLEWLEVYEAIEDHLKRIQDAIAARDELEAA